MITERKRVVGVMGGSKAGTKTCRMAEELGSLIAQRGWVLLNGGRNQGVMAASAKGAKAAGGTVIGILPDRTAAKASPDLDYVVMTGMGDARNVINVLSSDVVVACPGALGTLSEITLALKAEKSVILLGYDVMPEYERYRRSGQLTYATDPADAVKQVASVLNELAREGFDDAAVNG